jgi:N-glycosylase/DNA lyase
MPTSADINHLHTLYRQRKRAIKKRLKEFRQVEPSEYFYELAYCLLTPQSSALNAESAITKLKSESFFEIGLDPEHILREKNNYVRFHRTKSKHLLRMRDGYLSIIQMLQREHTAFEMREWLVKHVKGVGYKEATHFLRNIGRNEGMAILDRHIFRNLKRFGVIRSLPKAVSKKLYLGIEHKMQAFARRVSIPQDELDLLFWSMETGEIRK